jgi:phage terminase large subunit-like protein
LRPYWDSLTPAQKVEHRYRWSFWARDNQLTPDGQWLVWLLLAGRGFGKTRTGAEWVRAEVEAGRRHSLALVAPTAADVRDVMIEGESGLLRISPPWCKPEYQPSKRRVVWPNGATATTYSAEDPDQLRGPNIDGAWCDELAAWKYAQEAWDMLMFTLRAGDDPRAVVTTTPRPTKIVRDLVASPLTYITRGRTYDNAANLARSFMQQIVARYAGTRLGRQELDAEILDDTPGALWKREAMIEALRVVKAPDLVRIVVGVDPAITANEGSDETGIIGAGVGAEGQGYVLEDASIRGTPLQWASAAVTLYHKLRADRIIAEANQGGQMVEYTIHTIDPHVPVKLVHASRGKLTRAEPVAAIYEQAHIHHVGTFPTLEDQLCTWTQGDASPDRLDALVWAFTELMVGSRMIPLADEPMPAGPGVEQALVEAITEAQADPFAYADKLGLW